MLPGASAEASRDRSLVLGCPLLVSLQGSTQGTPQFGGSHKKTPEANQKGNPQISGSHKKGTAKEVLYTFPLGCSLHYSCDVLLSKFPWFCLQLLQPGQLKNSRSVKMHGLLVNTATKPFNIDQLGSSLQALASEASMVASSLSSAVLLGEPGRREEQSEPPKNSHWHKAQKASFF